jgi:hypothetical protein
MPANFAENLIKQLKMKKLFYFILVAVLSGAAGCNKKGDGSSCDLVSTPVPDDLAGSWVNGFTSFTNIVDAYDGRIIGTTWHSGRYLHMESNGQHAVIYIMGGGQFSEFATRAEGTVSVDEANGTLAFHVCKAHYRGWNNGSRTVDRDATESEKSQLSKNLQFFYSFENSGGTTWFQLRFSPDGSPTSFRRTD